MSKIAVIKTGGKQYVVSEGMSLVVEKLMTKDGEKLELPALLVADGDKVTIGKPEAGKVTVSITAHGKDDKINVIKYKRKVRYRRKIGHQQKNTTIKIEKI